MTRSTTAVLILCTFACHVAGAGELKLSDLTPRYDAVFEVGDRAQLFIDRTLVNTTHRVWFTQHQGKKHPANPLVVADKPWEGWRLNLYGNVFYDQEEKTYKIWYMAEGAGALAAKGSGIVCYATSIDGITWKKPNVGTVDGGNGQPNNIVSDCHLPSVVKDAADPDPNRRYKMTAARPDPGYPSFSYWTMVSPDGFQWTVAGKKPIAPGFDVVTTHWDPYRSLYISFPKTFYFPWRGQTRRVFELVASRNFEDWSAPIPAFRPDLRDDAGTLARLERARPILDRPDDPALMRTEFYGVGSYAHESCTIAFPWIITINNNARWGNHDGPEEVQLAVSRDLVQWHRPFRTPLIASGKQGQWDCGYHTTASSAIRVGDEIWLYYGGANYTHGTPALYRPTFEDGQPTGRGHRFTGSIGLVTWKLDRFVSVDGPADGGTITTVPVTFSGNRLEINAAVKSAGQVVVELLDAVGRPLDGFSKSDPFKGDEVRHIVTFSGESDVSKLQGKPVTLRFHLADASLYSFAFRKADTTPSSNSGR